MMWFVIIHMQWLVRVAIPILSDLIPMLLIHFFLMRYVPDGPSECPLLHHFHRDHARAFQGTQSGL